MLARLEFRDFTTLAGMVEVSDVREGERWCRCYPRYHVTDRNFGVGWATLPSLPLDRPRYSGVTLNVARPDMNNYATLGVMLC